MRAIAVLFHVVIGAGCVVAQSRQQYLAQARSYRQAASQNRQLAARYGNTSGANGTAVGQYAKAANAYEAQARRLEQLANSAGGGQTGSGGSPYGGSYGGGDPGYGGSGGTNPAMAQAAMAQAASALASGMGAAMSAYLAGKPMAAPLTPEQQARLEAAIAGRIAGMQDQIEGMLPSEVRDSRERLQEMLKLLQQAQAELGPLERALLAGVDPEALRAAALAAMRQAWENTPSEPFEVPVITPGRRPGDPRPLADDADGYVLSVERDGKVVTERFANRAEMLRKMHRLNEDPKVRATYGPAKTIGYDDSMPKSKAGSTGSGASVKSDAGDTKLAFNQAALTDDSVKFDGGTYNIGPLRTDVKPGVQLGPSHVNALQRLQPYLPKGTVVTSAYRSPQKQFEVIRDLAKKNKVEWNADANLNDPSTWVGALAELRSNGVAVNAPYAVTDPTTGKTIPGSPHAKDNVMDFSGALLNDIADALRKAQADGVVVPLQIKLEPKNGAVHFQFDSSSLFESTAPQVPTRSSLQVTQAQDAQRRELAAKVDKACAAIAARLGDDGLAKRLCDAMLDGGTVNKTRAGGTAAPLPLDALAPLKTDAIERPYRILP